jgi:hypothetical protein
MYMLAMHVYASNVVELPENGTGGNEGTMGFGDTPVFTFSLIMSAVVLVAQAYVALRHPFCINDVQQQALLLDRRQVYKTLTVCVNVGACMCVRGL